MSRYNDDRDEFFTRNPDPTKLTGSDDTVVPPFVGTDPLTNEPSGTSTDQTMTDETDTMTQTQDVNKETDETYTCVEGSSASQPTPTQGSQSGSQPTVDNPDTWYAVVKI
jgi:hypothetical protein